LNLAQRFERLPMTRYQNKLFLIIATAWLLDSIDLAALTFVLAPITQEFGLTTEQAGLMASASFAGMFFGATFAGILGDRFGRRVVFQYSMIVWGVATLALAFSWDLNSLIVFRFLVGVGMGAEFPMALSLVSEFISSKQRGKYLALLEGAWPLGFIACGLLSLVLLPIGGWRMVFIVQSLLAVYVLVIRRAVPESPRWYESRGRFDEADATMRQIEEGVERASGRPLPEPGAPRFAEAVGGRFSFFELFTPRYLRRTLVAWALWFCVLGGYYGLTTWLGALLVENGFDIVHSVQFIILMTLWGIPGFLTAAVLVERLGRKWTLAGFVALSAAAAFFYGQASSTAELILAGSFMQFFFFGMWSSLHAYTPEIFPTRARGTGAGSASSMGRLGALTSTAFVPVLLATYGASAVFTVAALTFVAGALVVLVFGPETKQRVLEEVST
jgi:putative MFS transporter